jgi:hypothetical protein
MAKKDPRFERKEEKREPENRIVGEEIGNSTILSQHLANGSVTDDKTNFSALKVGNKIISSSTGENAQVNVNPFFSFFRPKGTKLYTDDNFISGLNGISVYNNNGGTAVSYNRRLYLDMFDLSARFQGPTNSPYGLEIRHAPTESLGISPNYGGWYFATATSANQIYICIFKMRVPIGRFIGWHSNSIGDNGHSGWLTSNAGTGKYEEYAYYVAAGTGGGFSSTFFFAIYGGDTSTFYTQLASATVFRCTDPA